MRRSLLCAFLIACGPAAPPPPERPVENRAARPDPPPPAAEPRQRPEEEQETALSSRQWRYAAFFRRLKRAVYQSWAPTPAMTGGTPLRGLATRVVIVLTPVGDVVDVTVAESSGFAALDAEALRAVRAAGPFANPPPGLVDPATNTIRFAFSFFLER